MYGTVHKQPTRSQAEGARGFSALSGAPVAVSHDPVPLHEEYLRLQYLK